MSFQSYFVCLSHSEPHFTSTIVVDKLGVSADFKRIGGEVYMVFFRSQIDLTHLQKLEFKKRTESGITVLFPVLAKYNQRKLKKLVDVFSDSAERTCGEILSSIAVIDKFIEVRRLLPFFVLAPGAALQMLMQLELAKKVKLIDLAQMTITSYSHYEELHGWLAEILQQAYDKREKSLKLTEIEKKIKVPASSFFFKYLLTSLRDRFEFTVAKNKLVMQKLPLSEQEITQISEITAAVRRQRLDVFSLDQLAKATPFNFSQLNDALWNMVSQGQIVQLNERHFVFAEDLQRIVNRLKKFKRNQGDMISIDAFRNLTGLSRKYIISLFEYFDSQHYTTRQGDKRKILLSV